jgi:thymidylate synthase (FAD)
VFRFRTPEALNALDFAQSALEFEYTGLYSDITPGLYLTHRESVGLEDSRQMYEERLTFGVAKEQARKDLPLSTMTIAIWKIDLHNLLHFLSLRMDGHAQLEIRTYANAIGAIVKQLYPVVWEAFEQYRLNSLTLTALDIGVIRTIASQHDGMTEVTEEQFRRICPPEWRGARSRERDECLAKLQKLGLVRTEQ